MSQSYAAGVLRARPDRALQPPPAAEPGVYALGVAERRDGLIFIPPGYAPSRLVPFLVMLHGAGGDAIQSIGMARPLAEAAGLIVLAPASRRHSWDVIAGGYGPDVALLDMALARVFAEYALDPEHIAIGGFSDGASYALSIGLVNGDLFTHVLAFSPGFMAPPRQAGAPRIFVSHGTHDTVLPIDSCSRRIVPRLERAGYSVRYHEFDGPHTVPPAIASEALSWFVGEPRQ